MPGKLPETAEINHLKCESRPAFYFPSARLLEFEGEVGRGFSVEGKMRDVMGWKVRVSCQRGAVSYIFRHADLRVCVWEVPEDLQFFVEAGESDAFAGVPEVRE